MSWDEPHWTWATRVAPFTEASDGFVFHHTRLVMIVWKGKSATPAQPRLVIGTMCGIVTRHMVLRDVPSFGRVQCELCRFRISQTVRG